MKNLKWLSFIVLVISSQTIASLSGQARGSIDLNYEQTKLDGSVEGNYSLAINSTRNKVDGLLSLERSFDDDKVLPNARHYLGGKINHTHNFLNPYLSWTNLAQYNQNYEDEFPESWGVVSGPDYKKKITTDLYMDLILRKARQIQDRVMETESGVKLLLIRSLSSSINASLGIERYCTESEDMKLSLPEISKECSIEKAVEIAIRSGVSDYRLKYGVYENEGELTDTYEVDYRYELNRFNNISMKHSKSDNNITNNILVSGGELNSSVNTFTTTTTAQYNYSYNRLAALMEARLLDVESDDDLTHSKSVAGKAEYRLGSSVCRFCLLTTELEKETKDNLDSNSIIIGINMPLNRNLTQQIALMRTENEDSGIYMSMNWKITYNGNSSILSR